jgi:hypothetical protein
MQLIDAVEHCPPLKDCTGVAAARARLAQLHARYQQHAAPAKNIYYPPPRKNLSEQCLDDLAGVASLDALITRNHYGSVVLNARRALFIDVDMPNPGNKRQEEAAANREIQGIWKSTFDDLCMVLENERGTGFRIYRTAAGFRILAISQEFEPGSDPSNELMSTVGADDAFVRLCGSQKTFRARLTPKPWRCGTTRPPNDFPRATADEEERFAEWLRHYDSLSKKHATCQYLGEVGSSTVHERVAPIIEFHDRFTKAFDDLVLA